MEGNPLTKLAMITGATSGIGKATALLLAKSGYNLIITGRREERLEELKAKIKRKYGVKVKSLVFDVRKPKDVKKAIKSLDGNWEHIDLLVNNAGLALGFDEFHKSNPEHWDTMIDTNIKGILNVSKEIVPLMITRETGQIINVCSSAGHDVYPRGSVYCASKFGVDALTKGMRLDLHKYNIRVGQVSPGHVEETEFAINRFEGDEKKANIYEDFKPLKAKDVAEIIHFMASRPKYVTIHDVIVMGTQQPSISIVNRTGR